MDNPVETFFDGLAPKWDEWANDDLLFVRSLFGKTGLREGDKALDVGCGTGVVSGLIHEMTGERVKGIDLSGEMIQRAKIKYQHRTEISFEKEDFLSSKGAFDFVMVYNAYPHFVDVDAFLIALRDHLAPGGRFAIVHSLGRARLDAHHEGLSQNISRNLLPVKEEAERFRGLFDISLAEEGPDHYIIAGKRK